MIGALIHRHFAGSRNQLNAQVGDLYMRIDSVFGIACLLALIEGCHQPGIAGDVEITIFVAIEYSSIATVYLRTFRHIAVQHGISINFNRIDA